MLTLHINFANVFTNKVCPISKIKMKHKTDDKLWIIRTLRNRIRKKNRLNHCFILKQTPESEIRNLYFKIIMLNNITRKEIVLKKDGQV